MEDHQNVKGIRHFKLQTLADEVGKLPPTIQSRDQSDVATSQVQLFPTVPPSQHSIADEGQQPGQQSHSISTLQGPSPHGEAFQETPDVKPHLLVDDRNEQDPDVGAFQLHPVVWPLQGQQNLSPPLALAQHNPAVQPSSQNAAVLQNPALPPAVVQNSVSVSQVEVQPDSTDQPINMDTVVGTDWCRERVVTQNKRQPSATNSTAQTTGSDGTITVTDRGVLPLWRTIGEWKKLATDADIARFLLSLYFNPKLAETQSDSRCVHCSTPLTMCCITCLLSAKQPAPSQSSSSGNSHLSKMSGYTQGRHGKSQDPATSEDEMEADSVSDSHSESVKPRGEAGDILRSDPLNGDLGSANTTASLQNETESCSTGSKGYMPATKRTKKRKKHPICDGIPFRNGDIPAFKHFSEYRCSKCDKTFKYKHLIKRHMKKPNCDTAEEYVKHSVTKSHSTDKYPICDGKPFRSGNIPVYTRFSEYKCSKCHRIFKYKDVIKRHMQSPDCDTGDEIVEKPTSQRCAPHGKPVKTVGDKDWTPSDHGHAVNCDDVGKSAMPKEQKQNLSVFQSNKEYTIEDFMTGKLQISGGYKYIGKAKNLSKKRSYKSLSHYSCEQCDKVFVSEMTYESHRQDHLKEMEEGTAQSHTESERKGLDTESLRILTEIKERLLHCCPHCSRIFTSKVQHRIHVRSHTFSVDDDDNHTCHFCASSFKSNRLLKEHQRVPKTEKSCQQCGLQFEAKCTIKRHMKKHEEENEKCAVCGESFDGLTKIEIRQHFKTHKQMQPTSLCPLCGKGVRNVKNHMKSHSDQRPFSCTLCNKSYKSRKGLIQHEVIHGEKTIQCEICGEYFYHAKQLERHKSYKHLRQMYECKECGKQLSMKRILENHIRIVHRKVKPYVCSVCGYGCNTQGYLDEHMRKHTGEKPYQCPHCPSRFSHRGYIKVHIRTHTGERPYGCDDCGQRFTCRASLTLHRRNHHSDKVFPCSECGETFPLQSSLDFHYYKVHGGNSYYLTDDTRQLLQTSLNS